MTSTRIAVLIMAMLLSAGASADRTFSTLEERMTGQEFRETGLYKLTDEELAALNRWIRQRSLAEGESRPGVAAGADGDGGDRRGLRDTSDRSDIRSRIVGNFTGWRGRTEFELENGQVWRQATPGTFAVREVENPEVTIAQGMFGAWYLSVDGYNSRVRVERIR
jgi:hypothetical protein